jgi:sulfur carrier protein ThiS
MAERRMFSKSITQSDAFLDMPLSSQALYFQLGMEADDDGFLNSPRRIQRLINASEDDLKLLTAKSFIIDMGDGVVVIKHWKMNNYIQKDRYKPTVYQDKIKQLFTKENGSYTLDKTQCIQNVSKMDTQVSIVKSSLDKNSIVKDSIDKEKEVVVVDNKEEKNHDNNFKPFTSGINEIEDSDEFQFLEKKLADLIREVDFNQKPMFLLNENNARELYNWMQQYPTAYIDEQIREVGFKDKAKRTMVYLRKVLEVNFEKWKRNQEKKVKVNEPEETMEDILAELNEIREKANKEREEAKK